MDFSELKPELNIEHFILKFPYTELTMTRIAF